MAKLVYAPDLKSDVGDNMRVRPPPWVPFFNKENVMKVNKKAEKVWSSDSYYGLFVGGYIDPAELLVNQKDIDAVNGAVETITEFFASLTKADKLDDM